MGCHICEVSEVKWSEIQSFMSNSLRSHGLYSPWNSPGQDTGVSRLSLLQGIFPTQGSNPGLLHCRQILYQLSYQGLPYHYNHFPGWYQYIIHLGLLLINLISWTRNLSLSMLYSLLCVPDVLSKKKKEKMLQLVFLLHETLGFSWFLLPFQHFHGLSLWKYLWNLIKNVCVAHSFITEETEDWIIVWHLQS